MSGIDRHVLLFPRGTTLPSTEKELKEQIHDIIASVDTNWDVKRCYFEKPAGEHNPYISIKIDNPQEPTRRLWEKKCDEIMEKIESFMGEKYIHYRVEDW